MTTAHRPTWKAAVGRSEEGGWSAGGARSGAVSALDAPAHTVLKFRNSDSGQKEEEEDLKQKQKAIIQRSLLELEQAEKKHSTRRGGNAMLFKRTLDAKVEEQGQLKLLKHQQAGGGVGDDVDDAALKTKYDDSDVDDGGGGGGDGSDSEESDLDNDKEDDSDLDSSSSDEDDEDEEAQLQAELAKIRAEREQAKLKAQEQLDREEQAKQEEAALLGNPLLLNNNTEGGRSAISISSSKRRRWNEDVVFRNQAKNEPKPKKRFINDTVRNDFHKRFLNKFIR